MQKLTVELFRNKVFEFDDRENMKFLGDKPYN